MATSGRDGATQQGRRLVPLDINAFWSDLSDQLVEIIEFVSDETLDWRPGPQEWSIREIVVHIAAGRHHWMANAVHDGETTPDPGRETKAQLTQQIQLSWSRMERFLSDPAKLDAEYEPPPGDPSYLDPPRFNGHYIAYHRLAHDIHHRADILHALVVLGVELPSARRRRPL